MNFHLFLLFRLFLGHLCLLLEVNELCRFVMFMFFFLLFNVDIHLSKHSFLMTDFHTCPLTQEGLILVEEAAASE